MANQKQLAILKQGVEVWNKWRSQNPNVKIKLSKANLRKINLNSSNLSEANLDEVDLSGAHLFRANFSKSSLYSAKFWDADLRRANFDEANLDKAILVGANLANAKLRHVNLAEANMYKVNLSRANLSGADLLGAHLDDANLVKANLRKTRLFGANLREANLRGANLSEGYHGRVDLSEANLEGANLSNSIFFEANFTGTNLSKANLSETFLQRALFVETLVDKAIISRSYVYGISVWNLLGEFEEQKDLIITPNEFSVITVDNIKVAQFIYLILNNEEVRDVINTLTSKSVLILGRFAIPERMAILDSLRNKLREFDLLPIVFDFDRPTDQDFTETIKTLAGLSFFVIADITNPKSSPLELQATVPDYQIPFVPIIQEGENPFAMMGDLQKKYDWVLKTVTYDSIETLMKVLKPLIIDPAMKKRNELRIIKAQVPEVISGKDYLDKGKE